MSELVSRVSKYYDEHDEKKKQVMDFIRVNKKMLLNFSQKQLDVAYNYYKEECEFLEKKVEDLKKAKK